MKGSGSSGKKNKPGDTANDESKSQSGENENLAKRPCWRFGSFTFLNLVSSAAIILGIGTAVLFARVYYDQRPGVKVPVTETDAPVDVPITIDGWEGDLASKPFDPSDAKETAKLTTFKPAGSQERYYKPGGVTERQHEDTILGSTHDKTPVGTEKTRYRVVDKVGQVKTERATETLKETSKQSIVEEHSAKTRGKPAPASSDEKNEEKQLKFERMNTAGTEQPKVRDTQSSEELQELLKLSTVEFDQRETTQTPHMRVDTAHVVDTVRESEAKDSTGANEPQDGAQQEQKHGSVDSILQRATNISDVEDMYQWVLDDAEPAGIQKVLSALEASTKSIDKMELAKACLLDRLSVLEETDSNVERALNSLTNLASHVNSTLQEKIFAHRKMAEKRLRQGSYRRAIAHMKSLIDLDPEDIDNWIELSTYNLYAGEVEEAKKSLETALEKKPGDGPATLNLGSLQMLSASQGYPSTMPMEKVADMLAYGLNNTEPSLHEARHYAQLYDALIRSGRESEAAQYMKKGVDEEVLLSENQLCQSYISDHTTKPFWTNSEVTFNFSEISQLVENFTKIYADNIEQLSTHPENPFLLQSGEVELLELLIEGERLSHCESSEETVALCNIAEKIVGNCSFCDSYVMKMSKDASYWKQSGVTNLGLRTIWVLRHSGNNATLTVDVADEIRPLDEQNFVIFDHSYVHRLRANSADGTSTYWIFVAESWHPNVDYNTKDSLRRDRI